MGLHIKDEAVLDKVLNLRKNIWPGADKAIGDLIVASDGHFYQPISLGMFATTPSTESYVSEFTRWHIGSKEARRRVHAAYVARGASDAVAYIEPTETNDNLIIWHSSLHI